MGSEEALKPPRVVLDTNCVISALLFDAGQASWLRESWQKGSFVPLLSRDTARELLRVLTYPKFQLEPEEQELLLSEFLPYAETVDPVRPSQPLPAIRDPHDAKFLALAMAAGADALVTGDSDLLDLGKRASGTPLMTIPEFSDWLEARG